MDANTLLGWLVLAAPILVTAGGLVGAALVKNWAPAREVAEGSADYVQAVREAVEMAERYGVTNRLPGAEKLAVAVTKMDDWLDAQGIHGDARKVTLERVKADIELMRARLFPSKRAA